jgi:salicylate hydroxylase
LVAIDTKVFSIVGAGIGGLAAALALQRTGARVQIYEQAPVLGEVGAGLTISPNASHVLDNLGLRPQLREFGTVLGAGAVRHYATNEILINTPVGTLDEQVEEFGNINYQIHRADLHKILLDAVIDNDPDCLKVDHQLVSLEQNSSGVTAAFANRQIATSDVLLACDGCRSVVRSRIFSETPPEFAGYVAYRGLVDADTVDSSYVSAGATLSIGPGQMFMRYPVRNGKLINAVGIVKSSDWQEDGWNIPATASEALDHFKGWHQSIKDVLKAVPQGKRFKWAILRRAPLDSWVNGRIVLMGDAAHTITPFLGQGAAMALEDAVIFSRAIEATDDLDSAIEIYDCTRVERGNWVFLESQLQGQRMMDVQPDDFNRKKSKEVYDEIFSYNAVTAPLATIPG